MKKIFIYTFIFIGGFLLTSLWCFYLIINPPEVKIKRSIVNIDIPIKPIELNTKDEVKLSAWYINSKKEEDDKKVVILLHGYPAEKSDMLGITSTLYPDFSIFLLDLRSFGESKESFTTLGIKEQEDVNAAVRFLKNQNYEKIGIFGISLGSTASLLSASKNEDIDAVGVDTSFVDARTLGYRTFSSIWILKYPIAELMGLWEKVFLGSSISEVLYTSAEKIDKPILLTHTNNDEFSIEHALKLKEILKGKENTDFYFPKWQKADISDKQDGLDLKMKDFFLNNL